MFSGIVEEAAEVVALQSDKGNLHLTMRCSFVNELKIDQSVAHNGVCLTVVSMTDDTYTVTAIKETLERSNLGCLKVGDKVNLERSMLMNGRLDGHIVQGHVDQTAVCTEVREADGSWYYTFEYAFDKEKARQGYMDGTSSSFFLRREFHFLPKENPFSFGRNFIFLRTK